MDAIFMLMCFVSAERWHSHHLKIKRRTVSRVEHGFDKMLKKKWLASASANIAMSVVNNTLLRN